MISTEPEILFPRFCEDTQQSLNMNLPKSQPHFVQPYASNKLLEGGFEIDMLTILKQEAEHLCMFAYMF